MTPVDVPATATEQDRRESLRRKLWEEYDAGLDDVDHEEEPPQDD